MTSLICYLLVITRSMFEQTVNSFQTTAQSAPNAQEVKVDDTQFDTNELQTRFPVTFDRCEYVKKLRKYKYNFITNKGITYDKSHIPTFSDDEIEHFIDLQMKYPEIINKCFGYLIEHLEQQEQLYARPKRDFLKSLNEDNSYGSILTPIYKMYDLLISVYSVYEDENKDENKDENEDDEALDICMEMADKWMSFIQSQNEFSKFFQPKPI